MNQLKRVFTATLIAIFTASIVTFAAYAISGPFNITESTLTLVNGVTGNPILLTNAACLGGSCKYRVGSTSSVNNWRWNYTANHTYQIWAYDPTIGESVAKYSWKDIGPIWGTTVDQSNINRKGTWVYIGYSDYVSTNTGGYLMLSNDCTGWTCGKKVLFDSMRYNTNP
jgi:hypothetical protein